MPLSNAAFLISMSCLAVFLSQLGMMMYLPALPSIAKALNTTQDLTSLAPALLLWLPYCLIICGQAINYPISLSQASEHSPVSGPYAMALCGFIHQVLAAVIGASVSGLGIQQPIALASLCLLLVVMVLGVKIMQPRA